MRTIPTPSFLLALGLLPDLLLPAGTSPLAASLHRYRYRSRWAVDKASPLSAQPYPSSLLRFPTASLMTADAFVRGHEAEVTQPSLPKSSSASLTAPAYSAETVDEAERGNAVLSRRLPLYTAHTSSEKTRAADVRLPTRIDDATDDDQDEFEQFLLSTPRENAPVLKWMPQSQENQLLRRSQATSREDQQSGATPPGPVRSPSENTRSSSIHRPTAVTNKSARNWRMSRGVRWAISAERRRKRQVSMPRCGPLRGRCRRIRMGQCHHMCVNDKLKYVCRVANNARGRPRCSVRNSIYG